MRSQNNKRQFIYFFFIEFQAIKAYCLNNYN